jgi:selenocysteine lyase/cysteine desulfurase
MAAIAPSATGTHEQFRSLFPALARLAWFDTPGVPPGATPVADAVTRAVDEWREGRFNWASWEQDAEDTRRTFARMLDVAPTSVGLLATLADAAQTVANSLPRRWSDGEIVVPAGEFQSNHLPWLRLAARGFVVRRIPLGRAADWTEDLVRSIGTQTRLVALSEVQSSTGVRADVPAVLRRCRAVGAELFLNATQSLGVLQPGPWLADVDYVAAHGYKWLLAPRGATWLYVHPDRLEALDPLAPSWKSAPAPLEALYGHVPMLAGGASKLDASLAWMSWAGARVALELIESLPAHDVEAHCLRVANRMRESLASVGLPPIAQDAPSHIVASRHADAAALARWLRSNGITASARDGWLRFGCHYFNSDADVDRVHAALASRPRQKD